jgi:DNA modification methylase
MVGSGTTLVECKLTGRAGIGIDINLNAVMVAMNRIDFELPNPRVELAEKEIRLFHGDARNLDKVEDESVDLIALPNNKKKKISYSGVPGDLSLLSLEDFIQEVGKVVSECFRALKRNKHCGILIGDTRKHGHYVPIHIGVLNKFLDSGFVLKEDIIKLQHNTLAAREQWSGHSYDFYKIAHEHLYVFRKPMKNENTSTLRYSMKWW